MSPLETLDGVCERDSANCRPWRRSKPGLARRNDYLIEIYDISVLFTLTGYEEKTPSSFSLTLHSP
jgi:hypothetical protein